MLVVEDVTNKEFLKNLFYTMHEELSVEKNKILKTLGHKIMFHVKH